MDGTFESVSTPDLIAQTTTLAGHLNAANARWLALIAELDRRNAWAEWGVKSCAHWLNWKCGIGLGAAREKIRVAHALEKLPRIAASMQAVDAPDYDLAISWLMQRQQRAKNTPAGTPMSSPRS